MWEKKRKLVNLYNSTVGHYDRRYRKIQELKFRAVRKYIEGLSCVLDVGCGSGLFLGEILESGSSVVGVDFSIDMLKRARENSEDAFLLLADADNLPFRDGSFDAVISLTLLQNMPEPRKTIREMVRVVEIGGKVIVTVLEKKHSPSEIEDWMLSANLKPLKAGKILDSEDVLCVGRREE